MKLNFKWKRQTGQYQNGSDLFLNRICVGNIQWNSTMSRDDPERDKKQYVCGSFLYPSERWFGATEEEVKIIIENKITVWFTEALKEIK